MKEAGAKMMDRMVDMTRKIKNQEEALVVFQESVHNLEALVRDLMRALDYLIEEAEPGTDTKRAARLYNRAEDLVGPLQEEN